MEDFKENSLDPTTGSIGGDRRPLWSVMVPVYNRTKYLAEALNSVLAAGYDYKDMQIEVVDDCSARNDAQDIVKSLCPKRISFYRQPSRVGMVKNWNACIARARGEFIHILHDDDFVARGYYREIEALAEKYPGAGLYSTRCFFVDDDSIILNVTRRVCELEEPRKSAEPFFYEAPLQFPGVTVRRIAYEALGGFRTDLKYAVDMEMWARVASAHGAVVSKSVKAFYRIADGNETSRLSRTAECVRDLCRLHEIFAQRYPEFSVEAGRAMAQNWAWQQYQIFKSRGDDIAAAASWDMWAQLTPMRHRLASRFSNRVMPYVRRLAFGTRV